MTYTPNSDVLPYSWMTQTQLFQCASKSYKSRRVTRSISSAEVVAFADLFDNTFAIRSQLEQVTSGAVPMHLTDSNSMFDIISKGSQTSEKRIMLDIHAARQAYRNQEISNIGFVKSSPNIADGLTKAKMRNNLLKLHRLICMTLIVRNGYFDNCDFRVRGYRLRKLECAREPIKFGIIGQYAR